MSKVHITLVGGQPAPVYHGIVATQPDQIVYIYSDSANSLHALEALKKEIQISSVEFNLDAIKPDVIKKMAETLAERYKNDEVTVNISSGLKSWSHWFGVVFHNMPNASIVYMDQNNVLWNYRTMESCSDFQFDMHVLFRLYGNSLENNFKNFSDYTDEDFEACKIVEDVRGFHISDFNSLTAILTKEKQHILRQTKKGRFDLPSGSFVEWDKEGAKVAISLTKKGKTLKRNIVSSHATELVFNSNWFELKVAKLISNWNKTREICMNCRFPFNPKFDKNEVDIIVNTGIKTLFVECKTQITNTTDIDKFRSVIKGYGGIGSKGFFITDSPMSDMAKEKCHEHGILSFSLKEEHLGLSIEKALFYLLDKELYNINAK